MGIKELELDFDRKTHTLDEIAGEIYDIAEAFNKTGNVVIFKELMDLYNGLKNARYHIWTSHTKCTEKLRQTITHKDNPKK